MKAWTIIAKGDEPPPPVVVFAQRRGQAKQIAYRHAPGFDRVDFTDVRCSRLPARDGEEAHIGMRDPVTGRWYHESFRRYGP